MDMITHVACVSTLLGTGKPQIVSEFSGISEAGIDHAYRRPYEHFMSREHSCYGDSISFQSWKELLAREEREPFGLVLSVA